MGDPSSFLGVAADPRFCSVSELQAQVSLAELGFYDCVIHLMESDQMFTLNLSIASSQRNRRSNISSSNHNVSQLVTRYCVNGSSKSPKRPGAYFNAIHMNGRSDRRFISIHLLDFEHKGSGNYLAVTV